MMSLGIFRGAGSRLILTIMSHFVFYPNLYQIIIRKSQSLSSFGVPFALEPKRITFTTFKPLVSILPFIVVIAFSIFFVSHF
jgi:hypothetical protein